jgi:hypothetical protein
MRKTAVCVRPTSYQPDEFAGLPQSDSRRIESLEASIDEVYSPGVILYCTVGCFEPDDAHMILNSASSIICKCG